MMKRHMRLERNATDQITICDTIIRFGKFVETFSSYTARIKCVKSFFFCNWRCGTGVCQTLPRNVTFIIQRLLEAGVT